MTSNTTTIRLLLLDDHLAFRQPLAFMLDREPDLAVAAQAGSLAEARQAILRGSALKADVVQYPLEIGRITIDTIARHLGGESVPPDIPVKVGMIDSSNAASN